VHTYRICGLSVASEIVLPGVIAGEPDSIPQITIRCGAVPEALLEATAAGPNVAGPNVAKRGRKISVARTEGRPLSPHEW
jgi:hypothetical protein